VSATAAAQSAQWAQAQHFPGDFGPFAWAVFLWPGRHRPHPAAHFPGEFSAFGPKGPVGPLSSVHKTYRLLQGRPLAAKLTNISARTACDSEKSGTGGEFPIGARAVHSARENCGNGRHSGRSLNSDPQCCPTRRPWTRYRESLSGVAGAGHRSPPAARAEQLSLSRSAVGFSKTKLLHKPVGLNLHIKSSLLIVAPTVGDFVSDSAECFALG
jgi:hypothetical protein